MYVAYSDGHCVDYDKEIFREVAKLLGIKPTTSIRPLLGSKEEPIYLAANSREMSIIRNDDRLSSWNKRRKVDWYRMTQSEWRTFCCFINITSRWGSLKFSGGPVFTTDDYGLVQCLKYAPDHYHPYKRKPSKCGFAEIKVGGYARFLVSYDLGLLFKQICTDPSDHPQKEIQVLLVDQRVLEFVLKYCPLPE